MHVAGAMMTAVAAGVFSGVAAIAIPSTGQTRTSQTPKRADGRSDLNGI